MTMDILGSLISVLQGFGGLKMLKIPQERQVIWLQKLCVDKIILLLLIILLLVSWPMNACSVVDLTLENQGRRSETIFSLNRYK